MAEDVGGDREFSDETMRFLRELAGHNERDWFLPNKQRYLDHVQAPSVAFVGQVGPKLAKLSRHIVADARPVGGSIMRIYRDVRFAKDKSPYRTSVGIHFAHDGAAKGDEHLPGFFLHLAPGDSWVYAGVWQPAPASLLKIRRAIVTRSAAWKKVRASVPAMEGESLKRVPPGFDAEHPLVEDLKRKDFTAGKEVSDPTITGGRFPERFVDLCRSLDPLNRFLATAMDVPY